MIAPYTNGQGPAGRLVLFKLVYFVGLSAALVLWPTFGSDNVARSSRQNWTLDNRLTFGSHFVAWDTGNYLFLSEEGYKRGTAECAFYPLYPLLIRGVSKIIRGHDVLIEMILANLISLAAFLLFGRIVARRYGESAATLALTLLLAFPGSMFFQFKYTEPLFFLLLMLLLLGLEENHYCLALAAAFLLPLTRAVGVFCIFPLLSNIFFRSTPAWWTNLANQQTWAGRVARLVEPYVAKSSVEKSGGWCGANSIFLVLTPLLGWATYFLLMWKWTGNAFEGFEAQKKFGGVQAVHNLFEPVRFVALLFNPTDWHGYKGSLLDRCVFFLLIDCFPLIWKLDKSWCVWAFFVGVV